MNETLKTVTIAQPGARQESMRAFLSAAERLELVGSAAGALTGWQLVRTLAPDLVVIEGGLPDEEVSLLLHYLNGDSNRPTRWCLPLHRARNGRPGPPGPAPCWRVMLRWVSSGRR